MPTESIREHMEINFYPLHVGSLRARPYMQRRGGGVIVNVSSVCGSIAAGTEMSAFSYALTKYSVDVLTRGLCPHLLADNIKVRPFHQCELRCGMNKIHCTQTSAAGWRSNSLSNAK